MVLEGQRERNDAAVEFRNATSASPCREPSDRGVDLPRLPWHPARHRLKDRHAKRSKTDGPLVADVSPSANESVETADVRSVARRSEGRRARRRRLLRADST